MTTVREIQAAVCDQFEISLLVLLGPRRDVHVSRPRQVGMYLTRDLTFDSYPQIGRDFHRHHATVISDVRKAEQLIAKDWRIQEAVEEIYDRLGTPRKRRNRRSAKQVQVPRNASGKAIRC